MFFSYNEKIKTAILELKVKASAKEAEIHGVIDVAGKQLLKISINAVPENGKANKAIVKMLAEKLNLKQNQLAIIKGTTGSSKLLQISDVEYDVIRENLLKLLLKK